MTGLRDGDDDPPGFAVEMQGEMWVVTLATRGEGEEAGIHEEFHVRTRN
jgi:hypothetical protein